MQANIYYWFQQCPSVQAEWWLFHVMRNSCAHSLGANIKFKINPKLWSDSVWATQNEQSVALRMLIDFMPIHSKVCTAYLVLFYAHLSNKTLKWTEIISYWALKQISKLIDWLIDWLIKPGNFHPNKASIDSQFTVYNQHLWVNILRFSTS